MGICPECSNGADIARSFTAVGLAGHIPPDIAAIVVANHAVCEARNLDREPGQLADCPCQHRIPEGTP